MKNQKLHLLILEDNPDDVELIVRELEKNGFIFEWKRVETEKEFKKALTEKPDIILADYKLPSFDGMAAIKLQQQIVPDIPLIIVSGTIGEDIAVDCLKAGATDYVLKDKIFRLSPVVKSAIKEAEEHRELKQAEQKIIESKQKYRNIFESANDGIVYLDILGKIKDVNEQAIKMFGGTKEKLINKHFTKIGILSVKNIQNFLNSFKKAISSENFLLDLTITNKKGKHIDLECSTSRIRQKGKTTGIIVIARDITEYTQAKEALKASEEKYRALVETTDTGYLILDETGKVIDANMEYIRMTGHKTLKDILGRSVLEWTAIYDLERNEQEVKKCLKRGLVKNLEIDYVDKKGRIIPIEINAKIVETKEGLRVMSLCRDITERKKMEFELIRLSDAVRMSTDSIVISDIEGKITDVNEATLKMYGTGYKKDLIGKISFDIIAPEDKEKAFASMKEVMEKGYIRDQEYHIVSKDGSKIPVEMSVSIMKGKDGEPIGFVGITRDITERKQAQEELQESEEKYKQLAETAKDVIMVIDLKGNVKYINHEGIDLCGYSKEEILKMNINDVLPEDKIPLSDKNFAKRIAGDKSLFMYEIDFFNKKGDKIPVEIKSSLITEHGKPSGVLIIARDITERKRIEKELQNRLNELETYHKITMGREGRIIEIKQEVNNLLERLGEERKYGV